MIVAKKTAFALVKRNCLLSPIDNSVRNLAMQGTENVTSPKQVYRTTRSQPAKNHHSTHTGSRLATGRIVGQQEVIQN